MHRFVVAALLSGVLGAGVRAADDDPLRQQPIDQNRSQLLPKEQRDSSAVRLPNSDLKPRVVSREAVDYLQRLRKNTPFGTRGFDLQALRAGMGSRHEPTIKGVRVVRVKIGEVAGEW